MATVIGIHASDVSVDVTLDPGISPEQGFFLKQELEAAHPREKLIILEVFSELTGRNMTVSKPYIR